MLLEQEAFILADKSLQNIVEQIKDEQWEMEMPEEFSKVLKRPVTLREIINYHAYDDAWVPDMLAGKTMDEVGKEAFKGDLLDGDPKINFAKYVDAACEAVRNLPESERGKIVHMSYGDYPATEYLIHITYFRGMRVYDIAKAIGVSTIMPADLVQMLWGLLSPHEEEWRKIGVFGPKVEVSDDAPLQTKLLALTGRKV